MDGAVRRFTNPCRKLISALLCIVRGCECELVVSPDDPFGRMMVQNLRKRGCVQHFSVAVTCYQFICQVLGHFCNVNVGNYVDRTRCALRTIHAYPTLASQVTRYSELGFNCGVHAQDMNHVRLASTFCEMFGIKNARSDDI